MIKLTLPVWLNKGEMVKLKDFCYAWWVLVESWIAWPLSQTDADTCTELVLNYLAWERDITRFTNEPIGLYRKRVKFAKVNSEDAGSVAGIQRIFQRLDIGHVEVLERQDGIDWDVIILNLSDTQLAANTTLLQVLIQHYGRTCRRYQFQAIVSLPMNITAVNINADYSYTVAS